MGAIAAALVVLSNPVVYALIMKDLRKVYAGAICCCGKLAKNNETQRNAQALSESPAVITTTVLYIFTQSMHRIYNLKKHSM